eukprot:222208-Prorocentrum_minimum.AAC.2
MVVGAAAVDLGELLKGWFGWTLKDRLLTPQRRAGGDRGEDGSGGGGGRYEGDVKGLVWVDVKGSVVDFAAPRRRRSGWRW